MASSSLKNNKYAALFSDSDSEEKKKEKQPSAEQSVEKVQKKKIKQKPGKADKAQAAGDDFIPMTKKKRLRSAESGSKGDNEISENASKKQRTEGSSAPASKDKPEEGPLPLGTKKTVSGGVTIEVIREAPAGATVAKNGDELRLIYEGTLPGKEKGDKKKRFDNGELDFLLGDGSMLPGFQIGCKGMAVGERRLIFIPWRMGYGKKGKKPKVPPRSDLEFDVSLNFCGVDFKNRISNPNMSTRRREAAKRRGKKPRQA
eukprot:TRINITY_DN114682_c0_g1_i1.p1 TRINITY_DN114682_c0_g1~~TRINITY_DN114682_c0_g1_i1.p1  ORF type:complete len:272 (-),score=65.18 TRINITY_DN114682_c0_g1_i1:111-887(-)